MKNLLFLTCLISTSYTFADEAFISIGEKIFNDVRFSKYFYLESQGDVNIETDQFPHPEKLVSCASCHQIDQNFELMGMRAYNDFNVKTPLMITAQSMTHTLRNTPSLLGIGSRYSRHDISHYDGELLHHETYLGNFTGPHNGWEKTERTTAINNIVKVIRGDKGLGDDFSYATLFLGVDPALPEELRVAPHNRSDIFSLDNDQLIELVVNAGTEYLKSIDFVTDDNGEYIGSMYDRFLKLNNIARGPKGEDSIFDYTRKLIIKLRSIKQPQFIEPIKFETHKKSFGFQEKEWRGLKVFFNIDTSPGRVKGMCINCHIAPLFTDQEFHNVGVTQLEFDEINGDGAFLNLKVPSLNERNSNDLYFLKNRDLGVWNFFARKDKNILTNFIRNKFCAPGKVCPNDRLLPLMLARFKTPSLRNLGMSQPYFHNGSAKTIEDTLVHYQTISQKVRKGEVRNPAPQLRAMRLSSKDIDDLNAFLNSLNEDYD